MSDFDQVKTPGSIYWQRRYAKAEQRITELEEKLAANERAIESYQNDETGVRADNKRLRAALQEIVDEDDGYWRTGAEIAEEALKGVGK